MTWAGSPRKTKLRAVGISGWDEQRQNRRILERDNHRCYLQLPGCTGQATEVDDVRPISQGGTRTDDNLRAICPPCHHRKSRAEAQAARPTIRRPAEPHPGLR